MQQFISSPSSSGEYDTPEMQRTPLEELVLQAKVTMTT